MLEGLISEFSTLLSDINASIGLALTIVAGLVAKVLLSLRRILDFHDEYFVKKRLKRISELTTLIKEEQPLSRFLRQCLENEAFTVSTGISASTLKMNALIKLHGTGIWTIPQLRSAAKHLTLEHHSLEASIKLSIADKFGALASLYFSIFLLASGAFYFMLLATTKSVLGFFLGVLLFSFFLVVAYFIASDYRSYKIASQIQTYFKNNRSATASTESQASAAQHSEAPHSNAEVAL